MPWRLIGFIVLFAVFLVFIAFNLGNSCDLSVGFYTFSGVPVYLTVFASFILGLFCAVPFVFSFTLKKKNKALKKDGAPGPDKDKKKGKTAGLEELPPVEGGPYGID
jgi:uncharacterized integral membrane protein